MVFSITAIRNYTSSLLNNIQRGMVRDYVFQYLSPTGPWWEMTRVDTTVDILKLLIYETGLITWKIIKELIRKELQNVE